MAVLVRKTKLPATVKKYVFQITALLLKTEISHSNEEHNSIKNVKMIKNNVLTHTVSLKHSKGCKYVMDFLGRFYVCVGVVGGRGEGEGGGWHFSTTFQKGNI